MLSFPRGYFPQVVGSAPKPTSPVSYTPPSGTLHESARLSAKLRANLRLIHPTLQCSGSRYTLGPTYSLEVKKRNPGGDLMAMAVGSYP